ncbi:phospholipase D family protein [Shewanella sp. AS1]|uniref:phospholipase D family protein n=1 Tax=Shewanella sp. AS1 TaxID=2907626 RepID=UPI001F48D24C|nr:phospholipase D family protein [Shewanella sp. AS1]MCE9679446.1 phospholipase D family protein [Shewanella sp. AS1]
MLIRTAVKSVTSAARLWIYLMLFGLIACSSFPEQTPLSPSFQLPPATNSPLAHYLADELMQHPDDTGVLPLYSGVDAFVARLAIIDAAQSSIDLQYYIYHDDETGRLLSWHLIDAANRGVRIRVLLDDLTTQTLDDALSILAQHPNIEIRLFNPNSERNFRGIAMLAGLSRLNHRMHNKSLTVDNLATILGGRNVGNEYFSKNSEVDFGDFDLLTIGRAVKQVSDEFDLYWNSQVVQSINNLVPAADKEKQALAMQRLAKRKAEFAHDEYLKRLELSQLLQQIKQHGISWYWGKAELFYDPPEKAKNAQREDWLLSDLKVFLSQAKQEVVIISPYFVPTAAGCQVLIDAVKSGVAVTVLTNSLSATDVLAVFAGYKAYRQRLVENGVTVYEVKANNEHRISAWKGSSRSSLHAKTFVIDKRAVFVGSFNFDPRSALINTEMGLTIEQAEFAQDISQLLQQALTRNSYRLALEGGQLIWRDELDGKLYYADPDTSFWQRFMADLIGLLPIESQL